MVLLFALKQENGIRFSKKKMAFGLSLFFTAVTEGKGKNKRKNYKQKDMTL